MLFLSDWLEHLSRREDELRHAAQHLDQAKQQLEVWTLIQTYRLGQRRRSVNVTRRQPGALHDLDDLPPETVDPLLERLRSDDSIVLAHRTLSGCGIRILVRIDEWTEIEHYKQQWNDAGQHVLWITGPLPSGAKLDPAVSDPSRVTFPLLISPTESQLWNPDARPQVVKVTTISVPEIRTPRPESQNGAKLPVAVERARHLDALAAIPADCDSHTFERAVVAARDAGLSEREINDWAASGGAAYDAEAPKRIESFLESNPHTGGAGPLVRLAQEHSWDSSLRRWQASRGVEGGRPAGRQQAPTSGKATPGRVELQIDASAGDYEAYEEALRQLGVERRYDEIVNRPAVRLSGDEWSKLTATPGIDDKDGWRWLTDRLDNDILTTINDRFSRKIPEKKVAQNIRWTTALFQQLGSKHDSRHGHDPLLDYVESLDAEQGESDPASWLGLDAEGPFLLDAPDDCSDTDYELLLDLAEWTGRYIVTTICARALYRAQAHIVPVLVGGQGIGKSSFLWNLLPSELSHLWRSIDLTDPDAKRRSEKLDGALLSEWAELDSAKKQNLSQIKALITDEQDNYRPAYGRQLRDVRPRGVIVATSNKQDPLPGDESGNRRFVVVRLARRYDTDAEQGEAIVEWWEQHRAHVYARAFALAKRLRRQQIRDILTLPPRLAARQRLDNYESRFRGPIDAAVKDALEDYDGESITVVGLWYRIPQQLRAGQSLTQHQPRLLDGLRSADWSKAPKTRLDSSRSVNYWLAPGSAASKELAAAAAADEDRFTLREAL